MEYLNFQIKNFKGIENLKIDFKKGGGSRVSALIGLNESGKTTVLEAINFFNTANNKNKEAAGPFTESQLGFEPTDLVPLAKKANFNEIISVSTEILLSEDDIAFISKTAKHLGITIDPVKLASTIEVERKLTFKNSDYVQSENLWSIDLYGKTNREKDFKRLFTSNKSAWQEIVSGLRERLTPILYFPTFLFDFPERIYLEEKSQENQTAKQYRKLIQDILDSLDDDLTVETHIIDRIKVQPPEGIVAALLNKLIADKNKSLASVLRKMEKRIETTIFSKWAQIFDGEIPKKDISILSGQDENDERAFLQFKIGEGDSLYLVRERSLGFR